MDAFVCPVEPKKFRFTNDIWNRLRLNSRWSIGSVTTLIQQMDFDSKEEWKDYYYASGLRRSRILRSIPKAYRKATDNYKMIAPHISRLPDDIIALNYGFGRTKKELELRAREMYAEIKRLGNPYKITLKECIQMVEYRVIGETWNGFILRKQNTKNNLLKRYPRFNLTPSNIGGIDFEVRLNKALVGAIQIKPSSFNSNHIPVASTHKQLNALQHETFEHHFNVPVHMIFADTKGRIENREIFDVFDKLLTEQTA